MSAYIEEFVNNAKLRDRIAILRAELAAAERKLSRIAAAIESRRQTLNRLSAQLAHSAPAAAHADDER